MKDNLKSLMGNNLMQSQDEYNHLIFFIIFISKFSFLFMSMASPASPHHVSMQCSYLIMTV